MSLKIGITGIEGFVGSYLAEYALQQKASVYGTVYPKAALTNIKHLKKLKLTPLDIRDQAAVEKWLKTVKPDWLVHLAAQSNVFNSPQLAEQTLSVNLLGTLSLLEAARLTNFEGRILIVGSANKYGQSNKQGAINERTPLNPGNPYAVSKACQEYIGQYYQQAFAMKIIRVRPFNHIGPRQAEGFVCSDFAKQIALIEAGQQEPVIQVGNIKVARDFTDVRDIIRGYWLLMQHGQVGEVYNLCSGQAVKIESILKTMIQSSSKKINIQYDENKKRNNDIKSIKGSYSKIKKHTGWKPVIPLKQTLADILTYWREKIN